MRPPIIKWQQFAKKIRTQSKPLLSELSRYHNPVLVTGCQRSGTTMMTNILLDTPDVADYRPDYKFDSELYGAQILAGVVEFDAGERRTCFQTTYLNENVYEYFETASSFKVVYMLRNPHSVVFSMVYKWKPRFALVNFALNELFQACGREALNEEEQRRLDRHGVRKFSKLERACAAYVGKTNQMFEMKKRLGESMVIIDYDELIRNKPQFLRKVYGFLNISMPIHILDKVHSKSTKRADGLSVEEKEYITRYCQQTYTDCLELRTFRAE